MKAIWKAEHDYALLALLEQGWTFQQIAEAFRTTRNAVAGRVYRLRQRLHPPS
jgi:ParB-like chromosome segregation protein Spo0J